MGFSQAQYEVAVVIHFCGLDLTVFVYCVLGSQALP